MSSKEIKKYIKKVQGDSDKRVGKLMKRYMGAYKEEIHAYTKGVAEQYLDIKKTLYEHTKTLDSHSDQISNLTMNTMEVKKDMKELKFHVVTSLDRKVEKKHFSRLRGASAHIGKRIIM